MKILFDHCVPKRLRRSLKTHNVRTAREMGWDSLVNGALLAMASTQFEVFMTIDSGIRFQQNIAKLPIAVIALRARSNRLTDLLPLIPKLEAALSSIQPGQFIEVKE